MIGIILPTRGTVFTEVENAIEKIRNSTWQKIRIFRSSDKKIPDGLNNLVDQALSIGEISHLWFIEEDTVPPPDSLKKLMEPSEGVTFIDYGVGGWSCSAKNGLGEVLWCGLGCTMVKRYVFFEIDKPYFRTDRQLRLNDNTWIKVKQDKVYGGQDIWFTYQVREKGIKIKQVDGECRHLGIEALGKREINSGLHNIYEKEKIKKLQIINGGE